MDRSRGDGRRSAAAATIVLLNAAALVERADESLVPAVYSEIGASFGAGPAALGWLTFIRALVQALASPLAAYLSLTYNRAYVVGLGALIWATATAMVALSGAYWQAAVARALNGVGLAVVIPAIQSLVADIHEEKTRGLAFGWLHASGQLGTVFGGAFATVFGGTQFLSVPGWRLAFMVVAVISFLLGLSIYGFVEDPYASCAKTKRTTVELVQGIKSVISLRTFQVIVAQGIVGQTPWNAMLFFTYWMELLGFSHGRAAFCVALLSLGNAVGSVLGGWIGDKAAAKFPDGGRIMCSQFSAGIGVPLSALLLMGLPSRVDFAWAYGLILFTMGLLMSWNSPATNWPIFSEIVPVHLRTTVYSIDMALEKSLAAAGAPLVGKLSEVFGFKKDDSSKLEPSKANAEALAKGLLWCIAVPFALCLLIISLLYLTYPRDRVAAATVNGAYTGLTEEEQLHDEEVGSGQAATAGVSGSTKLLY